jgi:hypothetical protein
MAPDGGEGARGDPLERSDDPAERPAKLVKPLGTGTMAGPFPRTEATAPPCKAAFLRSISRVGVGALDPWPSWC